MTRARDLADYIAQGVSTTELDILDGLTTTTAELNILDGKSFVDEDNMASNSATAISSQQSIKAYVDAQTEANTVIVSDSTANTNFPVVFHNESNGLLDDTGALKYNPSTGTLIVPVFNLGDTAITATGAELNYNDTGAAVGTVVASKTVTVDANKDASSFRNITMAGDLSIGGDVITASNATLDLAPNGTGTVVVRGNTNSGAIVFNCENNSHGQKVFGQPHSANVTNTLMLPAGANSTLVSLVSTDTLTNKTLTSPKINEDVAVTSTATELNLLDGVTATTAELNILDGVTSTAAELNILDGVTATAAELNALDGITAVVGELNALDIGSTAVGTAVASKAVILDANKDYTGVRNLTISGELDAATLDVSGNVDVDGVLETDNLTIGGAQGSDGQVLTSTGSGVGWEDVPAGGGFTSVTTITSSATYTIPSDITKLLVHTVGGGGGGSGNGGNPNGLGGTGGTTSVASGNESITTISATGGGGGGPSGTANGGNGGIGSNGDLNIRGNGGQPGNTTGRGSGGGGSSYFGGGARGLTHLPVQQMVLAVAAVVTQQIILTHQVVAVEELLLNF